METIAHKWYSKTIYVDIETGEIISKQKAKKDYNITKTTKKIEYGKYSNITEYTRCAERKRQQRLDL